MAVPHVLHSLAFLGWTLQAALDLPAANKPRRRQVAELWCGVGSIWRAGARRGYEAIGYDKARIPGVTDSAGPLSEDITTPSGFLNAIHVVLSLVPGGLLWQGTDCSSMGWVNRKKLAVLSPTHMETYAIDQLWLETLKQQRRHSCTLWHACVRCTASLRTHATLFFSSSIHGSWLPLRFP